MFILSYKKLTSEGFVGNNMGACVDRDHARVVAEDMMRTLYKSKGKVDGMFFLEEVNKDGSLRNPVEFVVELNEHEVEWLVDIYAEEIARVDKEMEDLFESMISQYEDR